MAAKAPVIRRWATSPWDYVRRIPQTPEPLFMNLWLVTKQPPKVRKNVEVLIKSFTYLPMSAGVAVPSSC